MKKTQAQTPKKESSITSSLASNKKVGGKYLPATIESKWQKKWKRDKLYTFTLQKDKPSYYTLVELPYPSGDLHLGHWFTFVSADAHARYMKMSGQNVFFPNGFDAFGLPAENAAIKRHIHPRDWTMNNIETMHMQFETMGTMIDWTHEAITCLPEYYRFNQWIFLKMFEKGIAYRGKTLSNWCPLDQTVLANEHVEDGKCWRCGSIVEQKEVSQWFLKITDYADRLLWENTDQKISNGVDWPQSVREGQNSWIGRSEGLNVKFHIDGEKEVVEVFTTRPDTLFGATFLVMAPEHKIAQQVVDGKLSVEKEIIADIKSYIDQTKRKTEMDRKEMKQKTGVFSGLYAINPINKEKIPVWLADYVLLGYGTGAIMAVPAHDERDHEFAKKFGLPVRQVIEPSEKSWDAEDRAYDGKGRLVNSEKFSGQENEKAKKTISEYIQDISMGVQTVQYHLRDWSISRQRYWGTPVPIIHCETCGMVPVPENQLPVELPYEVDYTPQGMPPLATATEWMNVRCPKCSNPAKRDAETLDTFFDSSWYFFRYMDPKNEKEPFSSELASMLMPLAIYFGGAEHTLGHTLYARFFTKFFHDLSMVSFEEFAKKRVQHGIILGPDGHRMSKSRGNVVNPDEVVKDYGADTVRLYLSFMMPFEATAPWNPSAITGVYRFLRRIWELRENITPAKMNKDDLVHMHKTIKKVGEDLANIKFNTAVAFLMEWLNYLSAKKNLTKEEYRTILLLTAPFAPHLTEELWEKIGESYSIHKQKWPAFDKQYLQADQIAIVVQVDGKVRDTMEIESGKSKVKSEVTQLAKENSKVQRHLEGKKIKDIIYIEGKIINFVTA